jgi:transposase
MLYILNIHKEKKRREIFHFFYFENYCMKKVVKQVLGIDVAQKELVVCFGKMYDDWIPQLQANKTFANNPKGFAALIIWINKLATPDIAVRYVMEATGVYHERFAYYLEANGQEISIVLPNKISNYFRTLEVKTITDKTASEAIAQFGLERNLDRWVKPNATFRKMRQLTRERGQIIDERTVLKNQLHAETSEAEPSNNSINRIKNRIKLLNKQEKEIQFELKFIIKANKEIDKNVTLLCTIPGVGLLTATSILGETNGFELIKSKKQLTSYAGLDVREKQSGTSVKGKPRISKKGNRYLRKALHLPALAAIRHNERYKAIFIRLVSKHGIKMKAAVAVQRKLLEMTYTIFKTGMPFDKKYLCAELGVIEELEEAV